MLDVGCGTGRLAVALAERGARVWGIDPSKEMLAVARSRAGPGVNFKRAEAERLPFKEAWFERAVFRLVVHHLRDRARAFAELRRVLAPGGRIALASFNPEHFEENWLHDLFPAVYEIDRSRFPSQDELRVELEAAAFAEVRTSRLRQTAGVTRAEALERIRGRHISTLRLLDDPAYERGLARAERELPDEIEYHLDWLVLDAVRPPG